jgi:hypothetical protein
MTRSHDYKTDPEKSNISLYMQMQVGPEISGWAVKLASGVSIKYGQELVFVVMI